ncbi:MAG: DUF6285 domain-containing protein [Candidatus Binatia bacterium]
MQDRPDARELLEAVRAFLEEQVVPALDGTRQFHARVAANVLTIVGRELAGGDEALRVEWRQLVTLLAAPTLALPETGAALLAAVRALNETLATRIRSGDADDGPWRHAVLGHLRATADARLAIANPKYAGPRAEG